MRVADHLGLEPPHRLPPHELVVRVDLRLRLVAGRDSAGRRRSSRSACGSASASSRRGSVRSRGSRAAPGASAVRRGCRSRSAWRRCPRPKWCCQSRLTITRASEVPGPVLGVGQPVGERGALVASCGCPAGGGVSHFVCASASGISTCRNDDRARRRPSGPGRRGGGSASPSGSRRPACAAGPAAAPRSRPAPSPSFGFGAFARWSRSAFVQLRALGVVRGDTTSAAAAACSGVRLSAGGASAARTASDVGAARQVGLRGGRRATAAAGRCRGRCCC